MKRFQEYNKSITKNLGNLTTYPSNKYINEGIRDKMTPKSREELLHLFLEIIDNESYCLLSKFESKSVIFSNLNLLTKNLGNMNDLYITNYDEPQSYKIGTILNLLTEGEEHEDIRVADKTVVSGIWEIYPTMRVMGFRMGKIILCWIFNKPFLKDLVTERLSKSLDKVDESSVTPKYRFKTEIEFKNEFGKNWREIVGWRYSDREMDYLLGTPLECEFSKYEDHIEIPNTSPSLPRSRGWWTVRKSMITPIRPNYNPRKTVRTLESVRDMMTPRTKEEIKQSFTDILRRNDCPLDDFISGYCPEFPYLAKLMGEPIDNLHVIHDLGDDYNYESLDKYFKSIVGKSKYMEIDEVEGEELVGRYICYYPGKKLAQYFDDGESDNQFWIYSKPFYTGEVNEGVRDKMTPKSDEVIQSIMSHIAEKVAKELVNLNKSGLGISGITKYGEAYDFVISKMDMVRDLVYEYGCTDPYKIAINIQYDDRSFGFKNKTNEGVRDMMTPKSKEDISSELNKLYTYQIVDFIWDQIHRMDNGLLPDVLRSVDMSRLTEEQVSDLVELCIDMRASRKVVKLLLNKKLHYVILEKLHGYAMEHGATAIAVCIRDHMKANESIRDKMTPKSKEDIMKSMAERHPNEVFATGIEMGMYDLVKYAIDHGSDKYLTSDMYLRVAITRGNVDIVDLLCDSGVKIKKDTYLSLIISNIHVDMLDFLIKKGLISEDIPLSNQNYMDLQDMLRKDKKTDDERELLKYIYKRNEDIRKMVDKYVGEVEKRYKHIKSITESLRDRMTPKSDDDIKRAVKRMRLKRYGNLVEDEKRSIPRKSRRETPVSTSDIIESGKKSGSLPSDTAARIQNMTEEEQLKRLGYDIDEMIPLAKFFTGLRYGFLWLVQQGLDSGEVDIDCMNGNALDIAVRDGDADMVELLLKNGADVRKRDYIDKNNREKRVQRITELLKKHGAR